MRAAPRRVILLVYAVGILVTVLLSNDATAIVLTPVVAWGAGVATAIADNLPVGLVASSVRRRSS